MPKHTRGRVFFTPEIGEAILRRMAAGEPLLRICGPSRGRGMPDRQTVYEWLRRDEGFYRDYLKARVLGAQALGEEIVEIADGREPPPGEGEGGGGDGGEGGCREVIEHRQGFGRQVPGAVSLRAPAEARAGDRSLGRDWLRITARRWMAGVMAPKVYAERELFAGAFVAPRVLPEMTEMERAARIAAILEGARVRQEKQEDLQRRLAAGAPVAEWEKAEWGEEG